MNTDRDERERLIAAATSAYRARDVHGHVITDAAWLDLDADGRREAFALAQSQRALEAALDPDGLSATGRAIMAKILAK
jgi:hypothetical protein